MACDCANCRKLGIGAAETAQSYGWNLQSVNPVRSTNEARNLVRFWNASGCIVCCGTGVHRFHADTFGKIPVVFIDRPSEDLSPDESCIYHNSVATTTIAARELLKLRLPNYAFVNWTANTSWTREREVTFSRIMGQHGHSVSNFKGSFPICKAKLLTNELAKWLKTLSLPVGILAATDRIAELVLGACKLMHISIPSDVALIGIDNDSRLCESSIPAISSVEPDFIECGRMSVHAIARLMDNMEKPIRLTYPTLRLVARESSRRLIQNDAVATQAIKLVREEACNNLTAAKVASLFPCSRRMAQLRFQRATGHSILDEISSVRLEKAKELLRESPAKLEAVANWCGYGSALAFSRFFRRMTGTTPSQWRKASHSTAAGRDWSSAADGQDPPFPSPRTTHQARSPRRASQS